MRRKVHSALLRYRNRRLTPEQIFASYWRENHWRNPESRSGDGSTLAYTAELRASLATLIARRGFSSLLDLPCGDFNWFSHIQLPGLVHYIGADIVPDLIAEVGQRHGAKGRQFIVLDAIRGDLPRADVWLCRDLILHLPSVDVLSLLHNFVRSSIRYLLVSSYAGPEVSNDDTFMGGARLLDLRRPPFSLPDPEDRLVDYLPGQPERYLLLYERSTLEAWWQASGCEAPGR